MSTTICSVTDCGRPRGGRRKMCEGHYYRLRAHGATGSAHVGPTPLAERFATKFVVTPGGCWRWTAAKSADGYGQIGHEDKVVYAHRASYEIHVGPIPAGLHIDHLCGVRSCVNPCHLEAVTQAENNRRAVAVRMGVAS